MIPQFYLFVLILIMSTQLSSFMGIKNRDVTESERYEVTRLITNFYKTSDVNDFYKLSGWFYENKIRMYFQNDSSEGKTLHVEDAADYVTAKQLANSWGERKKIFVKRILFSPQPYDVPESDLYFVDINVDYERMETYESFFVKQKGGEYKLYKYWVVYRSDRNTRNHR